jgi:glycosyltransferase involved in cell wall biosynthesis
MPFVPVPTRQSLAAIVTVMNEERTLPDVLEQLNRLPLDEIVVVMNGTTDGSFSVARRASNAVIVHFPQPLGHDVGRAVGAKLARSDLLLFLDGDIPVGAEQLVPFVAVLAAGADIALNDISPNIGPFGERDAVTVMKEFLNRALGRPDLQANSLTAVPHAMSRKALETIGYKNLIVPPLAQSIAIRRGLKIECAASVDVVTRNRIKTWNAGDNNPVSRLIVGDHVEALSALTREAGSRLDFPDSMRVRRAAGGSGP